MFVASSTQLREDNCAWARIIYDHTGQTTTSQMQGYASDSLIFQAGVQHELATDWFLALSGAYQQSSVSSPSGWFSASGNGGDIGIALKRQWGPWLFSAAVDAGWVSYDNTRTIGIAGGQAH